MKENKKIEVEELEEVNGGFIVYKNQKIYLPEELDMDDVDPPKDEEKNK